MEVAEFAQRIKDPLVIAIQHTSNERDKNMLTHVVMMINDTLKEVSTK